MSNMKVLVTGVKGQLGYDVMRELSGRGFECVGSDILDKADNFLLPYINMDITDKDAVWHVISEVKPDAVIHCAAWTAVDAAEEVQNRSKVYDINVKGTENIAVACKAIDAKMLYISTDYVFSGEGDTPWEADCCEYSPLNFYGETKLAGEEAVASILAKFFIVRIAWVFGINGNNFVKTMLRVGKNHTSVRVVNDQIGTPTYTADLARLLIDMIITDKYGYYHATNSGEYISWYDFCREIYRLANIDTKIVPVTTEQYGLSKARRPYNSRMDRSKLEVQGFNPLPKWENALKRYIDLLHIE